MNITKNELINYFEILTSYKANEYKNEVVQIICPTFPLLSLSQTLTQNSNIIIGAQNVSEKDKGAFTGEVSAEILSSVNIEYCIIGHSERRQLYRETDDLIRQKYHQLQKNKMHPILCIGETLEERENGKAFLTIEHQITSIFEDTNSDFQDNLIIAYEPVWAIGTGKTATPQIAQEVHKFIRELFRKKYTNIIKNVFILYGGSVNPSNIKELISQNDIDGVLIGGASLNPNDFRKMVELAGD